MEKVDFKKTLDGYRAQHQRFRVIEVPDQNYLTIDGRGDPNTSPVFGEAVKTLYPVAYGIKFASKTELDRDYVVPPLEGLWWADDMSAFTAARDKSEWHWTLMLMVPDWVPRELFDAAVAKVAAKNPLRRLGDVEFTRLSEGRCVQTLHVGSFDEEGDLLHRMHHDFIPRNELAMTGRHHEIYLSDFRRVSPANRRTILRQPVALGS